METTEKESEKKLSVTAEVMSMLPEHTHYTFSLCKMKKVFIPCWIKSIESSTPSKKVSKLVNSNRICEVETLYFPCPTNYTNYINFAL